MHWALLPGPIPPLIPKSASPSLPWKKPHLPFSLPAAAVDSVTAGIALQTQPRATLLKRYESNMFTFHRSSTQLRKTGALTPGPTTATLLSRRHATATLLAPHLHVSACKRSRYSEAQTRNPG